MRQFGSKHSLVEPLVQLFHDPSRPSQIRGALIALHQFLDDRRIDFRPLYLFAFSWYFLFSHFHLYSLGYNTPTTFPTSSRDTQTHFLRASSAQYKGAEYILGSIADN